MQTSDSSNIGAVVDVPAEIRRWNWAAFLLNVFWGVAHRCYFSLLVFVPVVGLAIPFVLGAKGNIWAWKKGRWASSAQFLAAQRRWLRYALFAYAGAAVVCVALAWTFSTAVKRSEPFQRALAQLEHDAQVAQVLGVPLDTGLVLGSFEWGSGSGKADMSFRLTGPKASGRAYVSADKRANVWTINQVAVELEDGRRLPVATAPGVASNAAAGGASVFAATTTTHGRINDYANVLRPEELAALQTQLEAHQTATGQAFGVMIMPTLAGVSSDAFGEQLARAWAAGRAGSDTGLLIVLALKEQKAQIRISPKLSGAYRPGLVSTLIQEKLDPAFQTGQYGNALASTFEALARQQRRP